jgi:NADPH:quinone reductase-like Zn-dependent oxidoreductase
LINRGVNRRDFQTDHRKTFKLAEIAEAHGYMESNEQIGKIVVTV